MNDIHIKEPTSNNDRSSGYLVGKKRRDKKLFFEGRGSRGHDWAICLIDIDTFCSNNIQRHCTVRDFAAIACGSSRKTRKVFQWPRTLLLKKKNPLVVPLITILGACWRALTIAKQCWSACRTRASSKSNRWTGCHRMWPSAADLDAHRLLSVAVVYCIFSKFLFYIYLSTQCS